MILSEMKERYIKKMQHYIDEDPDLLKKINREFSIIERHYNLFEENGDDIDVMVYAFRCGEGWFDLIENILELIQEYVKTNIKKEDDECIQINTVKEKFGGLRIYIDIYASNERKTVIHRELNNKIAEMANKSYLICETCGDTKTAKLRTHTSYIQTLCDSCSREKDRVIEEYDKKHSD